MIVNAFGPLSVVTPSGIIRGGGFGGAQPRGVLEMLLLACGNTMSKEQLAEALWGDEPPRNSNGAVEQAVSTLRRRLVSSAATARMMLQTEPNAYRLATEHLDIDLVRFEQAWQRATLADGDEKYAALATAAACAREELLADAPYAAWAVEARERFRLQSTRAHLMLASWHLVHGRPERALHHCDDAVRLVPLSDEAHRLIMIADAMLGHSDLARDTFRRFTATLHTTLGATPSSDTAAVAEAIGRGEPNRSLLELGCPHVALPRIIVAA